MTHEDELYDVVIIGAGLEALHVVSRLPESVLQRTLVVDASGGWLHNWRERCRRLQVDTLRTPVTLHPHSAPNELRSYAKKRQREKELLPGAPGFAPLPSTALLHDFCEARIIKKLPGAVRTVAHDQATVVLPLKDQTSGALCSVQLSSGRTLQTRTVIVSAARCRPVVPAWAQEALASAHAAASDAANAALSLETWNQVDLPAVDVHSRRVVVVGGGMTSALLALRAAEKGAAVTLIARRPLVQQPFQCDVEWWGNKGLNRFWQCDNPVERLKMCRRVGQRGSVNPAIWQQLVSAVVQGGLTVIENMEIAHARATAGVAHCSTGLDGRPVWAISMHRTPGLPTSAAAVNQPTAFQQAVAAALAASDAGEDPASLQQPTAQDAQLHADVIWLACGSAFNAGADPMLQQLQAACPARMVGGYPALDTGSCVWPGAPVYFIGRGALLAVGPAAGSLAGMRLAADRIVRSVKRLDFSGQPDWAVAAAKVAPSLAPATPEQHQGGPAVNQPGCDGGDDLPLEEEGQMFLERLPRRSASRSGQLIDVSDLPASLPRCEVQRYMLVDSGFHLKVILELDEEVAQEHVRTMFTDHSLEVWVVGRAAAHRLHVPQLYGRVLPQRCSVRVKAAAQRVTVVLHKQADAEWPFLKGR